VTSSLLDSVFSAWGAGGAIEAVFLAVVLAVAAAGAVLERTSGPEVGRLSRSVPWVVVAAALAFYAEGVRRAWAFSTDDAFITLRYASNLAGGAGLSFNPGEAPPVDGYSNFTYLLFGALAIALGADPILTLKIVSVAATGIGLLIAFRLLATLVGRSLASVGVLYLSTYYGVIWWSVSGLETGFYMAIVVGAVWLILPALERESPPVAAPRIVAAGLLSAVGAMTRPEGALVGLVLLAILFAKAVLVDRARGAGAIARTPVVRFLVAFAVPLAGYCAWRLGFYGRILPNSVHCKADWVANPWSLLDDFVEANAPLLLAAVAGLGRAKDPRTWPLFLVPGAYAVILHGVDPIIGHETRHFVGSLPLAVGAGLIGAAFLARGRGRWAIPSWLALCAWLLVAIRPPPFDRIERRAEGYAERNEIRRGIAAELDRLAEPGASVLLGDAGIIPFASSLRYLDAYCLNSREMTSSEIDRDPERFADDVLFRERPEFIVINNRRNSRLDPYHYLGTWPAVIAHGEFKRSYEYAWHTEGARYSRYWIYRRKHPADGPTAPSAVAEDP